MVESQEQSLEQEIRDDARKRAERIKKRAQRTADDMVEEARAEAEEMRRRILNDARQEMAHEEDVHEARVQQELARRRRKAVEDILNHVRDRAKACLEEISGSEQGRQMLVRLSVQAMAQMRGDGFELVLSQSVRDGWGEELAADVEQAVQEELERQVRVRMGDEALEGTSNVEVRSDDMHEVADQSLDARIGRMWSELRPTVAEILNDGLEQE